MPSASTAQAASTGLTAAPSAPISPRGAHWFALVACAVAALTLLWPLLGGHILFGGARSDMYIAGYSFRLFGADAFCATGLIPQWNPYLFGGLPYIGAMHGDILYPTAWLRWVMPVDLAITWGMVVHLVLAGWFMYRFCRALGLSWSGSTFAGIAYEMTGIVASQMSPGHDGKLFVSALAPLAFWVLLHAIRRERTWAFGVFAVVVALIVLGHYHMAYFLLVALGLWTLYLVFWDPERPHGRPAWRPLVLAAAAVIVGVGITALQVLPFLAYIPYSPRAAGGPNTGWEFATSFAMPPSELFTLVLPEFNGVLDHYWGSNPLKFHTEYMGVLPLVFAALALGDKTRRRLVIAVGVGALFFLLLAFGGHTPFYAPFYALLPGLNKIRAMGMVFYLTAFALCVLAGIGFDRVVARNVPPRTALGVMVVLGVFALLGVLGALQPMTEVLALPERLAAAEANAPFLRAGALRLLIVVALAGSALWATTTNRLVGRWLIAAFLILTVADLWSVDRQFFTFSPRASILFADDAVTNHLRQTPPPYRVLDGGDSYGYSILMAYRIPVARGYHGFELERYNELGDVADGWRNLLSPSVLDLLAVRFLIFPAPQAVAGYHQVVAPTPTAFGTTAVLYERDTIPAYARVLTAAVRAPDDRMVPTLIDPRYPTYGVALVTDTSSTAVPSAQPPFQPSSVDATVSAWQPGAMTVSLRGSEPKPSMLMVSENWYPDWHAEVDGRPAAIRRVDYTLIGVDIPPGAREVRLVFSSASYARGKLISILCLLIATVMMVGPLVTRRRTAIR